jgi:hypothetical protein
MDEMRITPENLNRKLLPANGIFVFGSNELGHHGSGAAYTAREEFGAKVGLGFGFSGSSLAIPTKDWNIKTLPLDIIEQYVNRAIALIKSRPMFDFYITKIGCGLAGYTVEQIAPMFRDVMDLENVYLPSEFRVCLSNVSKIRVLYSVQNHNSLIVDRDWFIGGDTFTYNGIVYTVQKDHTKRLDEVLITLDKNITANAGDIIYVYEL